MLLKNSLRACNFIEHMIKYGSHFVLFCKFYYMNHAYNLHGLAAILVFLKLQQLPARYFIATLYYVHQTYIIKTSANFQLYGICFIPKPPYDWATSCY